MGIQFQTDQSGANNNVCTTTSQTFNFSLARSNTLESASFSIKKGSSTTAAIIVTVYDQPNGTGNTVESISVAAANVTQTFSNILFTFTGNTTLNAGTSYSLKVSSSTSCSGSSPYSIKVGNFQVIDTTTNNIINTGYGIGADLLSNSSLTASSNATYLSISNMGCNSALSGDIKQNNSVSVSMNSVTTINVEARRIVNANNNSSNKIKLDGNNIMIKLLLGGQKRRMYHGNRMIIDKT